jgi:hypothetical protein
VNHLLTSLLVLLFSMSGPAMERNVNFWHSALAGEGINAENLSLSQTVANHLNDVITSGANAGRLSRPYLKSPLIAREIMAAKPPIPDPGGVPGALRWDVPGVFRGSNGTWELVVDPKTETILQWNFVK